MLRDHRGNIASIWAIAMVPVFLTFGAAIDYSNMTRAKSRLQETSDSAALYVVKELESAGNDTEELVVPAEDVIAANFDIPTEDLNLDLDRDAQTLQVALRADYKPYVLTKSMIGELEVNAFTEVKYAFTKTDPKCFVSLSTSASQAIKISGNGKLDMDSCDLQANSDASDALDLNGRNAAIDAKSNCVVGGTDDRHNGVSPPPENCAVMHDPFDNIDIPATDDCTETSAERIRNDRKLEPGLHCGGWDISGNGTDVELEEGLYIIKDGPITMSGKSKLIGDNVTILFTGANVGITMAGQSSFNLKAMKTGDFQGFVFYFDPASVTSDMSSSLSGNADTYFEGIAYFGKQHLKVTGNGEVNATSPFSVVIADTIDVAGNGTLHFDIDEDNTDYEVPEILFDKEITAYITK